MRDPFRAIAETSVAGVGTENLTPDDRQSDCDSRTPDGRVSDQAAARRAYSIKNTGETRGRKHGPASASDRTEPQGSAAGAAQEHRSSNLRLAVPNVPHDSEASRISTPIAAQNRSISGQSHLLSVECVWQTCVERRTSQKQNPPHALSLWQAESIALTISFSDVAGKC